ncbi:MAG: anthranilate synthase component I family protein, partial [Calothrix sp. SM1_7_51]|nr:anthranilate synthase component I family protein [Calothrix sp. SM1_7_51]
MVLEFQPVVKPIVRYQEKFFPIRTNPIVVLQNLLEAGLISHYVMYEGKNEVRIAANELAKVSISQDCVSLKTIDNEYSEPVSDPFKQVEKLLGSLMIQNWTAYGYIGFDIARFYSSYSKAIEQDLLYFFIPEIELKFTKEGVYVKSIKSIEQLREIIFIDGELPDFKSVAPKVNIESKIYQQSVQTLIDAIHQGDLHKAIISRSLKMTGDLDVLGTYTVAGKANNSARSYCLKLGDVSAVGFSPETLIEVYEDASIVTNPLAGTRPRGKTLEEDKYLMNELFTDAKEVKEHALSVLLAQSEIASICLPGSVKVYKFMEVKKYRCVQHLSSKVGGNLKPGNTLWDGLKVLFPGVTVSGIDKEKALEWIDQLENEPRGIYAGCIGWVDSNGTTDLAIAIRSVYQYGNSISLNAGAGIVAESVPEREYIESVNKMNTMLA